MHQKNGKDIFAVPGNLTSINSEGTNRLIQEGAYLFKDITDLLI